MWNLPNPTCLTKVNLRSLNILRIDSMSSHYAEAKRLLPYNEYICKYTFLAALLH